MKTACCADSALEYLESNLSGKIVAQLRGLAEPALNAPPRPAQEVLNDLMASHQSILLNLKIASAGAPGSGG